MKNHCLLVMLASCLTVQAQLQYPEVKIEARVANETGQSVSNASVTVWFSRMKTANPSDGQEFIATKGVSDEKGVFAASNKTLRLCGIKVEKDGYYLGQTEARLGKHKDGKWIPWHQVMELTLRKKASPTGMYAKKLDGIMLPSATDPLGYDLLAGDWVPPFGKGAIADMVIRLQREYQDNGNYSWKLTMQTPKEGDGFSPIMPEQESPQSALRFPRTAPADGYSINPLLAGLKYGNGMTEYTNSAAATNFFFRVRTELDEHKRVKKALYGKLVGPIEVQLHYVKTGKLSFTYYLNPEPNSRNMEFDPQKNLFGNLSVTEP